ncbi:uncharacterized protein L969DRAFT_105438 [Mixia osmundae IAM 14324]|uniref:COQ9 C-terminal domain-containing protein n=1 Tax=Mixia osmundae (strain CBS 9802 / IAM 14324 / JCM 22182 / KY 12970) TaxID=764103 RepID=G7DZL9_MIXOS|nr:uncharacterized protein L969DRAFT_105438 [Mixia osmundae IAM 14324]KEI37191.1 hypothetical protein L969DRAFT_105438 [Mixia osmundae IAM 14324]GAA96029.1 hypothetical protein E5Q_02689 [Mixia osmundae IAM 14324]
MKHLQLLDASLRQVPQHGYTTRAFIAAIQSDATLPQYKATTLHAIFPSRPPITHLTERISKPVHQEPVGPARALFQRWLDLGREDMEQHLFDCPQKTQESIFSSGLHRRLEYSQTGLEHLPQGLKLLSAPSAHGDDFLPVHVPLPDPRPAMDLARSLCRASGNKEQGTDWYSTRLRLVTIYGLCELHLLGTQSLSRTHDLLDALLLGSASSSNPGDVSFLTFVGKSWQGILRSRYF